MKSRKIKGDDIYIDCQPVNSKGTTQIGFDVIQEGLDETKVIEKSGDKLDISGFLSNPFFGVVIGGLGLYAIIKIAQLSFGAIEKKK